MGYKLRSVVPAMVVAAAAVLAGCGSAGTDGPALTRAQLIAKATPICKATIKTRAEAAAKLEKASSPGGPPLEALASSAPALAASQSQAVAQLRNLNPPASLAHDWQSLLAGLQKLANDTAQIGVYAKQKNIKAIEQVVRTGPSTRKQLVAIATRDGLGPCGEAN